MATNTWLHPASTQETQVYAGTVATNTNSHVYTATLTNDDGTTAAVSYTVSGSPADTTTVAAAFVSAWNASTNPHVARITASNSGAVVSFTADTAGVPFSIALSASGGGSWSGAGDTNANVGNNDYGLTQNWSEDALPTTNDDVVFGPASTQKNCQYSMNQSSVAIDDFKVLEGCSSQIGRIDNGVPYYLRIDPNSFSYEGKGSLGMFDIGNANISPYIASQGTPSTNFHNIYLTGSNIATLEIAKGDVGLAVFEGETSTVNTVEVGYLEQPASDVSCTIGSGVTLTTLTQYGGTVDLNCAATTVTQTADGVLTTSGTGAIGTMTIRGTAYLNSSGTITTLNVYGTVDFSRDRTARTITTLNLKAGARLILHSGITVTNQNFLDEVGSVTIEYV